MARSTASSSPVGAPVTMRSASTTVVTPLLPRGVLQRAPDQFFGRVCTGTGRLEQARGLGGLVPQRRQGSESFDLRARTRRDDALAGRRIPGRQFVSQLDDHALRGLAADAGHFD